MSEPTDTIKKRKKKREEKRKRLTQDFNELKEEIKGNPKMVEAIRKLEERIEILEEEV